MRLQNKAIDSDKEWLSIGSTGNEPTRWYVQWVISTAMRLEISRILSVENGQGAAGNEARRDFAKAEQRGKRKFQFPIAFA